MSGSPGGPPVAAVSWSERRSREAQRFHDLIWPQLRPNEVLRGSFLAAEIDQFTTEWGDNATQMAVGVTNERLILVKHTRKFEAYGAVVSIRPEDIVGWRGRLPSSPTRARIITGVVRCALRSLIGRKTLYSLGGYRYAGVPCGEFTIVMPDFLAADPSRHRQAVKLEFSHTYLHLVPALPRPWLGDAQTTGPARLGEFLGACAPFEPGQPRSTMKQRRMWVNEIRNASKPAPPV